MDPSSSQVLTQLPGNDDPGDLYQATYSLNSDLSAESVLSEYMASNQTFAAQPIANHDCFFGSLGSSGLDGTYGMGIHISEAGTTLSEMLSTESMLNARRSRTESQSSTSSVLTSLLQQDTPKPVPVPPHTRATVSSTSLLQSTSPTLTQILQSDQVTSSTEMALAAQRSRTQTMSPDSSTTLTLVEVLKQENPQPVPPPQPQVSISDTNITLTEALTGHNPIVKSAASKVQDINRNVKAEYFIENKPELGPGSIFEDVDTPLISMDTSVADVSDLDIFGLEDETSLMFENGIAATDMGSLLAQFEEAAGVSEDEQHSVVQTLPQQQTVTMTTATANQHPASAQQVQIRRPEEVKSTTVKPWSTVDPDSEVVKLLKAKRPLVTVQPQAQEESKPASRSILKSVLRKSSNGEWSLSQPGQVENKQSPTIEPTEEKPAAPQKSGYKPSEEFEAALNEAALTRQTENKVPRRKNDPRKQIQNKPSPNRPALNRSSPKRPALKKTLPDKPVQNKPPAERLTQNGPTQKRILPDRPSSLPTQKISQNRTLPEADRPTQSLLIQKAPTQNRSSPEADRPTQNVLTQKKPSPDRPTQNLPNQKRPSPDRLTQNVPTQNLTTQKTPSPGGLTQNVPTQSRPSPHTESKLSPDVPSVNKPSPDRPTQNRPAPAAAKPAPSQEMIDKIKASTKRKSTIMLTDALPPRGDKAVRSRVPPPHPPVYQSRKVQRVRNKEYTSSGRGSSGRTTPLSGSPPPIPLALQQVPPPSKLNGNSSETNTPRSGSPIRVHLPDINLDGFTPSASPTPSASSSYPSTPSKPVKKISISQYKNRLQSRHSSRSNSPVEEMMTTDTTVKQAAVMLGLHLEQQIKQEEQAAVHEVNSDYFDLIADHDYCQNVPLPKVEEAEISVVESTIENVCSEVVVMDTNIIESVVKEEVEVTTSPMETVEHVEVVAKTEEPVTVTSNGVKIISVKTEGDSDNALVARGPDLVASTAVPDVVPDDRTDGTLRTRRPSVLKSLLMDKNLAEECKNQAVEDRAASLKKMETNNEEKISTKVQAEGSTSVEFRYLEEDKAAEEEEDDDENGEKEGRFEKFETERTDLGANAKASRRRCDNEAKKRGRGIHASSRKDRGRRSYRRHDRSPPTPERATSPKYDKLPSYFTDVPAPKQPGMPRNPSSTKLFTQHEQDIGFPSIDRDPSPERNQDPHFNKMPAYFSCFTNSTKYDNRPSSRDPLGLEMDIDNDNIYEWDKVPVNSNFSSRSETPNLVIASRHISRANSISRSRRNSRSKSPQRSCSRSHSRSRSPRSRSSRSGRGRHRSYSSSSDCSTCESSSRSRSRSRSRYSRSRHHSSRRHSRSHDRHRSRSHDRYRSRSRLRSRSRSRSLSRDRRRRNRRRSVSRSQKPMRQNPANTERVKEIQNEERRIVYVGRIPSDYTRWDLRRKFESFGEITDVSVHFREHGDNYGFVTFMYTCDAYSCVEKGNTLPGCKDFDMCFGGRRQFCKTDYADLDGNMEMEEEMGAVMWGGGSSSSKASSANMDFDELLKQALRNKKK